jgi:hypothetical protein
MAAHVLPYRQDLNEFGLGLMAYELKCFHSPFNFHAAKTEAEEADHSRKQAQRVRAEVEKHTELMNDADKRMEFYKQTMKPVRSSYRVLVAGCLTTHGVADYH